MAGEPGSVKFELNLPSKLSIGASLRVSSIGESGPIGFLTQCPKHLSNIWLPVGIIHQVFYFTRNIK